MKDKRHKPHSRKREVNSEAIPHAKNVLSKKEKVADVLEIPQFAVGGIHLEMYGDKEAIIEGCKGVLEYDEDIIKLNMGKMSLKMLGDGLVIKSLGESTAVISGKIMCIQYEY